MSGAEQVTMPALFAVIEFASPAAMGWLAAAALPWLINLWNRRRHVEAPWAAVELLLDAVREQSRRMRLRELLLMLLRTAIIAAAALAAARPVWRESSLAGSLTPSRTHHVVAIDRSFSMSLVEGDRSRLDRAKQLARDIARTAATGDAVSVIAWADVAESVLGRPAFDRAAIRRAIDSIGPSDAVADLRAVLAAAAAAAAPEDDSLRLPRTRIVLISDLTRTTWGPLAAGADGASQAAPEEIADAWRKLAARGEIVVEEVADGSRANGAVVGLSIDSGLADRGQPLPVEASVRLFGGAGPQSATVELLLDGEFVASESVMLQGGEPLAARFQTPPCEPGFHVLEARLHAEGDSLSVDNRRWRVFQVGMPPNILCVYDAPDAAREIARALDPAGDGSSGINVDAVHQVRLAATDLYRYQAIFLCNLPRLPPAERGLLSKYVRRGGAAVLMLGDRIEVDAYQGPWGSEESLLPVSIGPAQAGDWRLDPLDYRHRIMAPFALHSRVGLLSVRVSRYFPLQPVASVSQVEVPLALTSGDPAIVIGAAGEGRVAVWAFDPSLSRREGREPWSTLAVSPSFLPVVRELFAYLTQAPRQSATNRVVGQPLVAPHGVVRDKRGPFVWKSPSQEFIPAGDIRGATGAATAWASGVHWLSDDGGGDLMPVAVNVNPVESDLAKIDRRELLNHPVASSTAGMSEGDAVASSGRPLGPALLMLAGLLLLAELTMAWFLGREWR